MPYVKTSVNSRKRSKRSRGRKRRFAAFLAFVAIAVVAVVLTRHAIVRQPERVAALITPTPRPTPRPADWTPLQIARLQRDIRGAMAPALSDVDNFSIVVLDSSGRTLYADHPTTPVTPASVQKLIIAYTALEVLGPAYRFDTILAAPHAIASDGTLDGPLWLVGSGDPSFRSDDLRVGIDYLKREGLHAVSDGVAIDPTVFHGEEINPHWSSADANEDYQTAISGISIDGDTAEFRVYGRAAGEPARVDVVPRSLVSTYGRIESGGGDDVIIAAIEQPNVFRLSGAIPPGVEEKFWVPVHNIPVYAGSVLEKMLHDAGIDVAHHVTVGAAPLDTVTLWMHRSEPLPHLMRHMLYVSDNHYAEQLLRVVGGTEQGTADDDTGIASELAYLRSRSIPTEGIHVVDGSGLAEVNRVSAITLARILSDAESHDGGRELYALLPAGGRDGTLKYYHFTAAAGRIRAKTGHLSDADSLAGYIDTNHHGRLAFAFMINNSPGDPDAAYVRALDMLARF